MLRYDLQATVLTECLQAALCKIEWRVQTFCKKV